MILFSLVTTGKGFCQTQNFLQPELKKVLLWKCYAVVKIILKILNILSESGFVLYPFEATINLEPLSVLFILGNHCIIGVIYQVLYV